MLTDAAALALSLAAARLAERPARGAMTYGLGRAEILSAQANGLTLLVLAGLIIYGAIVRLISPPAVARRPGAGRGARRHPRQPGGRRASSRAGQRQERSLNVEGSYRHILTDLYGFIATAIAAVVILATGFDRADAIASLLIAGLMLARGLRPAAWPPGGCSWRPRPPGSIPSEIGHALAGQPGVVEVHDLHVWEVTSGFAALSAHVVVRAGDDCHELRRSLQQLLEERFHIHHTTLQVDHERGAAADRGPGPARPGTRAARRLAGHGVVSQPVDEGRQAGRRS